MKYNKIFHALAIAIGLFLIVMVAIPATPALAQSITLSPASGFIGAEVTVKGEAFDNYKGSNIYLYFDVYQMLTIKVSEAGSFTARFYVPDVVAPGASYYVTILDKYGKELARIQFTIKAQLKLDIKEAKISDWVDIDGRGFDADKVVYLYFSSDYVSGGIIDREVTAYKYIGLIRTDTYGEFQNIVHFQIPLKLDDGEDKEDVHGGNYYFYAVYFLGGKYIETYAKFVVINGEIEVDPEQGQVSTEVAITGKELGKGQKITIEYDDDDIDIASGNNTTDGDGKFSCTIIIPESTAGSHTITAIDESGNMPEVEFDIEPKITITPDSQVVGKEVKVSGTGFGEREFVAITFDDKIVRTTPVDLYTNRRGSFSASFIAPHYFSSAMGNIFKIEASDESLNVAEAQLTILAAPSTPAGISLRPSTSLTSPGYVGTELIVAGTDFKTNTTVTVTYSNDGDISTVTAPADAKGSFSTTFAVPPGIAGGYTITATDGTNTATSIFTMESEAPPMPVPLLPRVAETVESIAHFDWEDVTDPSGVTYTLQIGSDADFTTMVLEKEGLSHSEYTIPEEDSLAPATSQTPYYWRVKAVDGAFNESEWTTPGLFYVGFSRASIPNWVQYTFYVLGVLLLGFIGFWLWRRITPKQNV